MGSAEGNTGAVQLPVIDVSRSTSEVGKGMLDAAIKYGFLYIDTNGSGFSESIVDRQFEISRQFFALPEAEKNNVKINEADRGYAGLHVESLDPKSQRKGDLKEAFNIGESKDGRPQQPMPRLLEAHLAELGEFENACQALSKRVLDLLALGLEVTEPTFFSSRHTQPSGCTVRLLHYPTIPSDVNYQPDVDIRAGAHSDYGSITLLFQRPSQPGLEIRTPEDTWAPVPVIPDGYTTSKTFPPILVNIGDCLSYWTNGLLKSTVHRVIFPKDVRQGGEDRYSIAYFVHPGDKTELVAVPSQIVSEHVLDENSSVGYGGGATSKRAMTAREHLMNRLEATYGFRQNAKEVAATA